MRKAHVLHHPVIQWPVVLKLQRTERMGNALEGILQRMGKIIHRINAPFVSRILVMQMSDPVDNRVSHVDVRRFHIDSRPENL